MLPIKKIYIDSRNRSSDSKSSTDFYIDLPININLEPNTSFYLTDITIPVSFYTIESGRNNNVYFTKGDHHYHRRSIPEGNYNTITLNQAIATAMNTAYPLTGGAHPTKFTANPDFNNNKIGISNSVDQFQILTDAQALEFVMDTPQFFDTSVSLPLNSINAMIQNDIANIHSPSIPFISGYVDLYPIRNLYIVSQTLSNYTSVSTNGEYGILKKVPVSASYNNMIYDNTVLGMDHLDCSNKTLSRIDFKVKDAYGNIVNLHGNHWSFSIIFIKVNED